MDYLTDAPDAVSWWLSRHRTVEYIKLFCAEGPPPISLEGLTDGDRSCVKAGLTIKAATGLPFWDSVMLSASNGHAISSELMERAIHHNRSNRGVELISAKEASASRLRRMAAGTNSRKLVVLSSKLKLVGGRTGYIPMLDFQTGEGEAGLRLVRQVATALKMSGTVLASGKSYHFYGDAVLSGREQRVFLARAMLFSPIVDRAWVAHQLIEGECGLRISARTDYGAAPRYVERILVK